MWELPIWKSVHLSAASDCTRPLLSLLKTRHMQESMHRCVERLAEHLSQFSTVLCVCALSVDQETGFQWGNLRQRAERSKSECTFCCSDYKVHTFAVSCTHLSVPARNLNFYTLVKILKHTYKLNLPPTRSAITTRVQVVSVCLLHTKLIHNHYILQIRVCLYWEFTPAGEQANAMTQQAQCTRGMICLH